MFWQVYEKLTGVKVEGKLPTLVKEDVLKSLPPEWPEDPIDEIHALERQNSSNVLVVLDDDPTGTQTVHDIEVLTEWYIFHIINVSVCYFDFDCLCCSIKNSSDWRIHKQ